MALVPSGWRPLYRRRSPGGHGVTGSAPRTYQAQDLHRTGRHKRARELLREKKPGQIDSPQVQQVKALIRRVEARAAGRYCGLPVENLLGGVEGQGFAQLMDDLPYERTLLAIGGVAAMEYALELTVDHARHRKAFGKALLEMQNTRFTLAEVKTWVHVARVFIDDCIVKLREGRLDTVDASMAKWWVTDLQSRVAAECLQLFGGYGYMKEYPISRLYVDARVQRIYGGANEVLKEIIARSL